MRTFTEFLSEIFGFGQQPKRHPLADNPSYAPALAAFTAKHNGDEQAAIKDMLNIASTEAGRWHLKRMSMTLPNNQIDQNQAPRSKFQADNLGGAQMFGQQAGSTKNVSGPTVRRRY